MSRRVGNHLLTLLMLYRRHLRVQPLRELMAVLGVAAGVALLFAVQINNRSITGSFEQIVHGVAGRASLEVASRGPEGFDEGVYEEVARMADVKAAAPLFEQPIVAVGPIGSRALTLVGATEELASLGGPLIAETQKTAQSAVRQGLLVMTEPNARAIGARPGKVVAIDVGARTEHLALDAVVPSSKVGAVAESPVAAAPLPIVQALAGLPSRLTRVLIEPRPGTGAALKRALTRRFGQTLDIRSVDAEPKLLSNAAAPEAQLTILFGAISLVVAVILAYNALLLASVERRRFIVYLVQLGTPDPAIVASLVFDALILGIAGSLLGLLLGDVISLVAYRAPPGYLTAAFPIGSQRVIGWQPVLIALGAGLVAAFAAAVLPAIGFLRSGAAADPEAVGRTLSFARRARVADSIALAVGLLLIGLSVLASLLWPAITVVAVVALVGGLVLCLPTLVRYALTLARSASRRSADPSARLATGELKSSPTRSIALAATGTIAVFLTVTIGGSVADIQRAVRQGAEGTLSSAELWVRPRGAENIYATQPFASLEIQHRLQGLSAVRFAVDQNDSFLDLPHRRVWVIGVPPRLPTQIAGVQLVHGSLSVASRRLREGGWAVLSQAIASEQHLHLGERFTLPTPSGSPALRLAATVYNYGWPPGTILINQGDYQRLWRTTWASELDVGLNPGVSVAAGKRAVKAALPSGSALAVQTTEQKRAEVRAVLGATLTRLSDTTTVVLIAAIVSVVAMMLAAVWQRRGRLDALMSMGMSPSQLARLVFYEGGAVLLIGCLIGMASGILAQALGAGWAQHATDTQVHFAPAWELGLRTVLIAAGVSTVASVIAVLRTVRFEPRAAFSTE